MLSLYMYCLDPHICVLMRYTDFYLLIVLTHTALVLVLTWSQSFSLGLVSVSIYLSRFRWSWLQHWQQHINKCSHQVIKCMNNIVRKCHCDEFFSGVKPFNILCWPKRGLEYGGIFVCALKVQRYFPACDPAIVAVWNEWCMFVNELPCEWQSVTAGLTASHSDSGLGGLCDAVMLHIKKGSIEICSGSKGYHGDHSTSKNNKTGRPS